MATDESKKVLSRIKEDKVRFVDLLFTGIMGELKCVTVPSEEMETIFESDKGVDGSSILGFARARIWVAGDEGLFTGENESEAIGLAFGEAARTGKITRRTVLGGQRPNVTPAFDQDALGARGDIPVGKASANVLTNRTKLRASAGNGDIDRRRSFRG